MEKIREKDINEAHLGFIQDVITRMGQNSFQAKGWCVTLDSALIAFSLSNKQTYQGFAAIIIAIAVTVLFCFVDTYYLYLERGYRHLYNMAANIVSRDSDYKVFVMTIPKSKRGFVQYIKTLFRFVTGFFYLAVIVGLALLIIL